MKSIQVRYLPETNTLPSRFKAWAHQVKPVVVSVDSMDSHPFKSPQQIHIVSEGFFIASTNGLPLNLGVKI